LLCSPAHPFPSLPTPLTRSSSLGVLPPLASQHIHPLLPNTHPLPSCLLPHTSLAYFLLSRALPPFAVEHTHSFPSTPCSALSRLQHTSLAFFALLCPVSHTHRLPSPLTRSSSVGATRTSLALHTSQRALSRVCADGHSPNLSPSPKHYSCLSIEALAFYTEGRNTIRDHFLSRR